MLKGQVGPIKPARASSQREILSVLVTTKIASQFVKKLQSVNHKQGLCTNTTVKILRQLHDIPRCLRERSIEIAREHVA